MGTTSHQEFDTSRIPVDSAVLFRTSSMDDFELCHVLNVSTTSLEVLFTHTLPLNTPITFAVGDDSSPNNFYRAVGEVRHREPMGDDWLHVISAPEDKELWSSSCLYDVVCSSAEAGDELMENFHATDEARVQASPESTEKLFV